MVRVGKVGGDIGGDSGGDEDLLGITSNSDRGVENLASLSSDGAGHEHGARSMAEASGTSVATTDVVVSSDVGNVIAVDGDLSGNFAVLGDEGEHRCRGLGCRYWCVPGSASRHVWLGSPSLRRSHISVHTFAVQS